MILSRKIVKACLFVLILLRVSIAVLADENETLQNESKRAAVFQKPEGAPKRLLPGLSCGFSWTPDSGDDGMELTEIKLGARFALPAPNFKPFTRSFFLISPNFSYTHVNWKGSEFFPESLYEAGVSFGWVKPINERWTLMLTAMPSYAGDGKASRDTTRCPVLFAATWTPNPKWKVLLGAIYLDRSDIPFLPFAGVTYMPNEDWRFEFMAPQPKIARRVNGWCNEKADRWLYLGGGFGGGTWAIESAGHRDDLAMYREYSLVLGCESTGKSSPLQWNAEIAWLFGREMKFDHHTQSDRKLDDSLSLRIRCSY